MSLISNKMNNVKAEKLMLIRNPTFKEFQKKYHLFSILKFGIEKNYS
jgi:hypothetical protein